VTEESEDQPGRISSRRVYSGKVVSLDVDMVRFPNGSSGELEIIRHAGASAVVPFLNDPFGEDPEVALIRQYRYAAEGYLYEIAAGLLNEGETPEDCARRELKEETGYTASEFFPLATFFTTPGFTDERIHLFAASGLTAGESQLESDEFVELHPVALASALRMIESGEIIDGKTMIALLLASRVAKSGKPK
jgi:ADP-ribose pyrophosphatase